MDFPTCVSSLTNIRVFNAASTETETATRKHSKGSRHMLISIEFFFAVKRKIISVTVLVLAFALYL